MLSFRPVTDDDYERLGFVIVGENATHYLMEARPPDP